MLLETKGLKDFILNIKYSGNNNVMLLVQTFNNRYTNTKMPIYSFSNEEFEQVAKGKKLVEGLIVIKQIDLNMLKQTFITSSSNNELENYKNTIRELHSYNITKNIELLKKINEIEEKVNVLISKNNNEKNNKTSNIDLLNNNEFEISLEDVNKKAKTKTRIIKKINFTEVSENLDISEPSGAIVLRYFGSWS